MDVDATQQKIRGNWNQLKGKLKEEYGNLTDDDLKYLEGQKDKLVGFLQEKTGESREQIADFINRNVSSS